MRRPRIFTSQVLDQALINQTELALEEAPSHHLLKVLRLKQGAELILFNGQGGSYNAEIIHTTKKIATVSLSEFFPENKQSNLHTHMLIAVSRGERFEFALQKACELGVTEITPLLTQRTEVKIPKERAEKKMQSWKQLLISSCEQNQRNILPILNPITHLDQHLSNSAALNDNEVRLVLHHRTHKDLSDIPTPKHVTLLIGPEGGLHNDEITQAEDKQFSALALGPRVLRTETAPIAALSCCQLLWGDF